MRLRTEIEDDHAESMQEFRQLVRHGLTSTEIAAEMGLEVRTVQTRARKTGLKMYRGKKNEQGPPCKCHGAKSNARELQHTFGWNLCCNHCGVTWSAQQRQPTTCEGKSA